MQNVNWNVLTPDEPIQEQWIVAEAEDCKLEIKMWSSNGSDKYEPIKTIEYFKLDDAERRLLVKAAIEFIVNKQKREPDAKLWAK